MKKYIKMLNESFSLDDFSDKIDNGYSKSENIEIMDSIFRLKHVVIMELDDVHKDDISITADKFEVSIGALYANNVKQYANELVGYMDDMLMELNENRFGFKNSTISILLDDIDNDKFKDELIYTIVDSIKSNKTFKKIKHDIVRKDAQLIEIKFM